MKAKYLNYLILVFLIFNISEIHADTIFFDSKNIQIQNEGNTIYSKNGIAKIPNQQVVISGEQSVYNKINSELTVVGNVKFFDNKNEIIIESEKAIYKEFENIILTIGKTNIYFENKYEIISENVLYDRNSNIILSELDTKVFDDDNNIYNFIEGFVFETIEEIISSKKTNIIDNENNSYTFENIKVNLITKDLAGKEVKVEFRNDFFGIDNNDPLLKGRSSTSDEKNTIIRKAVFSTCNTENRKCRGWELESNEFIHNKVEQLFQYKNSWLKIFDQRVFFMPYFSHPDPSVKRKSGYLTPVYSSSDTLGRAINIPYFYAISDSEDMTFNPRIYSDNDFILQSEYRQAFRNSNLIADFSFNQDEKNTNTHAILRLDGQLDPTTSYNFEYQKTSNANYLKIHDFKNISDTNPLVGAINPSSQTSFFKIERQFDEETSLKSSIRMYEDATVGNDSDRYQYIFPDFTFDKTIELDESYHGTFDFQSSGNQKVYNTNIYAANINNNFNFKSFDYFTNFGLLSNYKLSLINPNSYSEDPTLRDHNDHNLFSILSLETSYPLKKEFTNSTNYIKPKAQLKFSPTNTSDSSSEDIRLGYSNLFSINRIRSTAVEEGRSLTIGLEFEKQDIVKEKIISFNLGSVIKDKKNSSMPAKSKLDQTRSDIVGDFAYHFNEYNKFTYDFSIDRDLDFSNYDAITTEFGNNKIVTSFNYVTENHDFGDSESLSNETNFKFNNDHSLKFQTTKDLKTDFTQFYDLSYKYETDCLLATLQYKKKFFRDGDLVPDESLYFLITFRPFTSIVGSANTIFEYK